MLSSRDDYTWVSQGALKRVQIDGMPYPVRPQKLIVKGEDEAYLREAIAERRYIAGMSVSVYTEAILRITQEILRADWLYDPLVEVLALTGLYKTWVEKEKVESMGSDMPPMPLIQMTGVVTYTRPSSVATDIAAYEASVQAADAALAAVKEQAYQSIVSSLRSLYAARKTAVDDAEEARDDAIADEEESLSDDLQQMESEHEAELERIESLYESGEIDARERDRLTAEENTRYEWAVETRRDEADKAIIESRDEYNAVVRGQDEDLYEGSKQAWATYTASVAAAQTQRDASVASARASVNASVTGAELSVVYNEYLYVTQPQFYPNELQVVSEGLQYSDAADAVARLRDAMTIRELCIGRYLKRNPLVIAEPSAVSRPTVVQTFAAHAPSSDAVMRAYADLERMRCVSMTPPAVYRNAHTESYDGATPTSYPETGWDQSWWRFRVSDKDEYWDGGGSWTYSNTTFSVYFGRREEIPRIAGIYATIALVRQESAVEGSNPRVHHRTYGYARVQLVNAGVVAANALALIDRARDALAAALTGYAETRDAAIKGAEDAYLDAQAANRATYDAEAARAKTQLDAEKKAHSRTCEDALMAAERTTNAAIVAVEEDDEGGKEARIKALLDAFDAQKSQAEASRAQADRQSESAYETAVDAAETDRENADAAAKTTRDAAVSDANTAYNNAAQPAIASTETMIDYIKSHSAEPVRENARCRWTFDATPIDSDGLSLPPGQGSSHTSTVWMAGIVHFDVVYVPKSLTGADFSDYYAELEQA